MGTANERERALAKKPRRLCCACCGSSAIGRQWWNRDTGYGLCAECVQFVLRFDTQSDCERSYGFRGIHFDLDYDWQQTVWPEVAGKEASNNAV